MSTYTISRDVCSNLLWSAEASGLSVEQWQGRLDAAGPQARLPMSLFDAMWRDFTAQDSTPMLGLRLGARFRLGRWGLVEHILLNSHSVGDAMQCAADYWRLVSDDDKRITLDQRADGWRIGFVSSLPHPRAAYEVDTSYILQFFQLLLGEVPAGTRLGFIGAAPPAPYRVRYDEHFGCPIEFDQPFNWVEIASDVAARPLPASMPSQRDALAAQAERQLATLGRELPVAQQVAQLVELGAADLAHVARHLHLSARSLQRRLEAEGVSFSSIRDAARRARMERLMMEPGLALKEIAFLLGFEERGLFEACIRWFGESPALVRERLANSGPR